MPPYKRIHLYGMSGAGSLVLEFLLTLSGVDYTISFPDKAERQRPEFRAMSLKGQIPILVDEQGNSMSESLAIIYYLLERFPEAGMIAPMGDAKRGKCLQWLAYLATLLYNANQRIHQGDRFSGPNDVLMKSGIADRRICYDDIEGALIDHPYLAGDTISAADLYLFMLLRWDSKIHNVLAARPRLNRLYNDVSTLAAIQQVLERQPPRLYDSSEKAG